jgi:hypothetical protein
VREVGLVVVGKMGLLMVTGNRSLLRWGSLGRKLGKRGLLVLCRKYNVRWFGVERSRDGRRDEMK